MTVFARDAEPGKIYRLTRDPGTTYYRICDAPTVRRLGKKLSLQSVALMRPADRFILQALERCRTDGHVLAQRLLRYRKETGEGAESKAYVAFPPDYPLREVEKPPGYGAPKRKKGGGDAAEEDSSEAG
jgi:hypothetical protein